MAQLNLADGLWAYYGFNDGTASNSTINGPVGTLVGNPTVTNGPFQKALYFNGVNSTVTFGSVPYFSPITVSAFVMLASPLGSGTEQDFVNQYPDFAKQGFNLAVVETNGTMLFSAKFHPRHDSFGTCYFYQETEIRSLSSVIIGKFYHVVLTYDGGTVRLFVNGVMEAQQTQNKSSFQVNCPWTEPELSIGSRDNLDNFFNGIIDEVYIYTRALSLDEIRQLEPPPLPPYIVQQPIGVVATPGSNATFNVSATAQAAFPLNYQWQRNGTNLVPDSNLVGVTSSSLSISNIQSSNLGFYSVVITNLAGSVTSSCVLLGSSNTQDTDNDGIPDWWENTFGLNPNNSNDATNHPPGDQLSYLQKYLHGLNPLTLDTDADGISDYDELFAYSTNPQLADTDADGIPDGWEIQYGLSPAANDATKQVGFLGVSYLQIYQYNLTHTNQLDPRNYFPQAGKSLFELVNNGAHTNRFYYDQEDRLVGEECSTGISIAYTYDGNGNILRQAVLSRVSETNGLPVLWRFLNGLTNNTSPFIDSDGDGWTDYQEWKAGTNPRDAASVPNLLGNPGANIASLTLPFTPSNFVVGVGSLDGPQVEAIVLGADGNPGTNTNYLLVLSQTGINGWSTQRVDVGPFGITSIAVGQLTNRPSSGIYVGLRGGTNGSGRLMEFARNGAAWQSNTISLATNREAFVLGIRGRDLLASIASTNLPDGSLSGINFATNWNLALFDTNSSHRSLGTMGAFDSSGQVGLRLLDNGGIQLGVGNAIGSTAYYPFDGSATDASTNGRNGTNNGVSWVSGIRTGAGSFNGTNSFIGAGALPDSTNFSFAAWLYIASTNSSYQEIFTEGSGPLLGLELTPANTLRFYTKDNNIMDYGGMPAGHWFYCVGVADALNARKQLWIDGNKVMEQPFSGPANVGFHYPLQIGRSYHGTGSPQYYFNGQVDDLKFYNRAVTSQEIATLGTPSFTLLEPTSVQKSNWRGKSLAQGVARDTNGISVFYTFTDDKNVNGTTDAGDGFVLAEYLVNGINASILTLSRHAINSAVSAQSYGLASANYLNTGNEVLFTGEPDGQVFAWTPTDTTNALQRQLFSAQHLGKAWHALAGVKTLEPGEGLVGLRVDPTNQTRCDVIFWSPQAQLPLLTSLPNTAPAIIVLPSANALGPSAFVTNRIWDAEGNASAITIQYQIMGLTNWQNATITQLDGSAYSATTAIAATPSGMNHTLTWNVMADLGPAVVTNVLLRARAQDFMLVGDWSVPTPFQVNMVLDSNTNGIPDWWETTYLGSLQPANGDFDHDGVSNYAEYIADTNPNDPTSYLRITSAQVLSNAVNLTWIGGSQARQIVQRSSGLSPTNLWTNLKTNEPPTPILGTYSDSTGTNRASFYRIRVERP